MRQLSGLDAAFLSLETEKTPMHIGGVSIIDPNPPHGHLDLDSFKEYLASRLHMAPAFRERLAAVPLSLGRPYWIRDDSLDLDLHIERTQLPEPGGLKEISALMAWETSQMLNRDRPLWRVVLAEGVDNVEGTPKGSIALISLVHHAAIDGVSGAEIMSVLYEPTEKPREVPPPADEPAQEPGKLDLLRKTGGNLVTSPKTLTQAISKTAGGLLKGRSFRSQNAEVLPLPFSAPRTRWSGPVDKERVWAPAILELSRIREIRRKTGATVNDVVLTVCAGALRDYLLLKDELPEKPLVAMVPVSVRTEDEKGTMGNQVSAMLVSLATNVEDPLERMAEIRRSADASKVYHQAVGAKTLTDSAVFMPFSVAGLATRLYTRFHLAERVAPVFNLVITNVPGPQIPLYVNGGRLVAHIGTAPLFDGMGLMLPVFSYNGVLAVGVTSCRSMMKDADRLANFLESSLGDLEEVVASD